MQCNSMFPSIGQILPQPQPRAPAPAQEQASCQSAGRSSERLKQKGSNIHPTSKQWSYVSSSAQGFPKRPHRHDKTNPAPSVPTTNRGSDPERPGASTRAVFSCNNHRHLKGRTGKTRAACNMSTQSLLKLRASSCTAVRTKIHGS